MDKTVQEKIEHIFSQYEHQTIQKNEILFSPELTPKGIYLLKKGMVRMYAIAEDGKELVINVFKPVSFFPVGWLINDTTNRYYYDAVTDLNLYIAPKDVIYDFLIKEPDVTFDLLQRVFKGLNGYFLRMEALLSGDALYKIVTHLCLQARRFGIEENGVYSIKLTHQQLATLTGVTRETVSRELKKLYDKGLVSHEGDSLQILDLKALDKEIYL